MFPGKIVFKIMLADDIKNSGKDDENGTHIQEECDTGHFSPGNRFIDRFGISHFEISHRGHRGCCKSEYNKKLPQLSRHQMFTNILHDNYWVWLRFFFAASGSSLYLEGHLIRIPSFCVISKTSPFIFPFSTIRSAFSMS